MRFRIELEGVGEGVPDPVLKAAAEHVMHELGRLFPGRVSASLHWDEPPRVAPNPKIDGFPYG